MSQSQHQKAIHQQKPMIMASIEVTTTIRITNATGMSTARINKIIQGIKQCHSFPVEVNKIAENKPGNKERLAEKKKLTVAVKC